MYVKLIGLPTHIYCTGFTSLQFLVKIIYYLDQLSDFVPVNKQ